MSTFVHHLDVKVTHIFREIGKDLILNILFKECRLFKHQFFWVNILKIEILFGEVYLINRPLQLIDFNLLVLNFFIEFMVDIFIKIDSI